MTDPSSITSVTEEDSDESDTTETSNSRTVDSVSSVLYSSECNTDDKLSSCLTNFSISKHSNASPSTSKKRQRKYVDLENENDSVTSTDPYPYGCHPLPLDYTRHKITQAKKRQKNYHSTALTKYVLQKRLIHKAQSSSLPKQEEENFGVDDPNNCLYTDFSDTSSIPCYSNNEDDDDDDLESYDEDFKPNESNSNSERERPFLPNMNSASWFQARCFDQYWSHYSFVMEWYRQHVNAVNMLSSQFAWPHADRSYQPPKPKKKNKAKRAKNRARNRRLAKARLRAAQSESVNEGGTVQDHDSDVDSELEMEITEDMMDFFAKSFKHRMERDQCKDGEDTDSMLMTKMEKSKKDGDCDSKELILYGPKEQPGIRRTAEMKMLYGQGAAMIHGMETALQMTYDKVIDRRKPKLWPNMPLKIVFPKSK